jgi:hypothetical protein
MYKEIQSGAVAKSHMTNGLLIQYMGKYLRISAYCILGSPSSYMTLQLLHFFIYEENLIFYFSVQLVFSAAKPFKILLYSKISAG